MTSPHDLGGIVLLRFSLICTVTEGSLFVFAGGPSAAHAQQLAPTYALQLADATPSHGAPPAARGNADFMLVGQTFFVAGLLALIGGTVMIGVGVSCHDSSVACIHEIGIGVGGAL